MLKIKWSVDMMKCIQMVGLFLFLSTTISHAQLTAQQQKDVDTITNRLKQNVFADNNGYLSGKHFSVGYDYVQQWMIDLKPTLDPGSPTTTYRWTDLNYIIPANSCIEFSIPEHLYRTRALIAAYMSPQSNYHKNAALLTIIKHALDDNLILPLRQHPTYFAWLPDWYSTYFLNKKSYAQCVLLLKGFLSTTELLKYSAHISDGLEVRDRATSTNLHFDSEFENAIWIGEVTVYKGAIENSFLLINKACQSAASKITIKSIENPNAFNGTNEGIMRDYSVHEHGKQLYSGGYGLWFTASFVGLLNLTGNTLFFSNNFTNSLPLFSDALLNGYQWAGYRGTVDFGSVGRNISRTGGIYGISSNVLSYMIANDPAKSQQYQTWLNNRSYNGPSGITGNRYFWQSDFMVHRGTNYYLSTKIPSSRTNGTETMNGENLKGANLPLGTMNINTRGSEYANIYPLWDWSRIPGTTAEMKEIVYSTGTHLVPFGNNNFGGGVSTGSAGVMAFNGTNNGIATNKAYFYLGDAVLCLGSGITASKSNPIITSLNQTFTNGPITTSAGTMGTRNDYTWAHHDNVGYIFPVMHNITIQNVQQSGNWNDIGTYTNPTTPQNVFSIWIDHGKTPANSSYEYIIAPDKNLSTFQTFTSNHGFVVDRNDNAIQGVRNTLLKMYAVVFYAAGKMTFGDGFSIQSDKPAIVLVDYSSGKYQVSVSDPLFNTGNVTKITFNKEFEGITTAANTSVAIITTPDPNLTNMTITNMYTLKQASIIASGNITFCSGGSVLLTSSAGTSYKWFSGTTQVGTRSIYTATTSGSYTVQIQYADRSTSTSAPIVVTVNTLPTATITSPSTSFCQGGNLVLTASTGTSYKWMNGSNQVGTASTYTATAAGSYMVEVTNVAGCKATSTAKVITVNALPTATITSSAASFCNGGSVVLTASAGSSYKWFSGTTLVGTNATYTATAAGSYTVEVTNAAGCKATSTAKVITANALPTSTITSPSNSFCSGSNVVLTASTGATYKWFNGATQVGINATYTATAAGSYTVEVTNSAGCKATSVAKTITINALPIVTITSPATTFCTGGNVVLKSSTGTFYKWMNGTTQVGTASTYTATAAGSYTVEVTNTAGCKATSSAKVITINALPTATITSPANSFCSGGSVILTASSGASYKWFNGATQVGTSATYTATAAGSYTVQVTNSAGCSATSVIKNITVDAAPTATITSPANSFCSGGSVVLTASSGASYKWFNGTTLVGTSANYTATTAGSYTIQVTNSAGCSATSLAKVISITSSITWYADTDGDGKGDPAVTLASCTQPLGYVSIPNDGCPTDPNKIAPGICGCGVPENTCANQTQTITFTPFNTNVTIGDPDFNLTASASSGLPITFTSSNTNVAIIVGNTVKIIGAGTTIITTTQSGNAMYAPTSASQTLIVSNPVLQGMLQVLDGSTLLTNNATALLIGSSPLNNPTPNKIITLKNTGTTAITITSIAGTPGFSATQIFPSGPIAPSQTASILISGIPSDVTAPTMGTITILSNDVVKTFSLNVSVEVSTTTGTYSSLSATQIQLFPNPTTGDLFIDFGGTFDEIQIDIYSIDGKIVQSEILGSVSNSEKNISINELPAGVYFLEMKTKQGKIVKRVMKQ